MGGFLGTLLALSTAGVSIPIRKAMDGGNKNEPAAPAAPLPMPEAPKVEDASAKAAETIKRKKANMTQSVYTSPLGLSGQADVARKTLLGQ